MVLSFIKGKALVAKAFEVMAPIISYLLKGTFVCVSYLGPAAAARYRRFMTSTVLTKRGLSQ